MLCCEVNIGNIVNENSSLENSGNTSILHVIEGDIY